MWAGQMISVAAMNASFLIVLVFTITQVHWSDFATKIRPKRDQNARNNLRDINLCFRNIFQSFGSNRGLQRHASKHRSQSAHLDRDIYHNIFLHPYVQSVQEADGSFPESSRGQQRPK